jgi:hypothetical protein
MAVSINDIMNDPIKRQNLECRFWLKVDVRGPKACWPWTAKAKHPFGYGCINSGRGNLYKSHVVAYALAKGEVPKGKYVLHSCDNAGCCNPRHLHIGSHAENAADVKERRRLVGKTGPIDPARAARKLNLKDARDIKVSPLKKADLAVLYGVTPHSIANILAGRTWANA